MRIVLHIGLPRCGAEALQTLLDAKRNKLAGMGTLYSRVLGRKNHTRLYMAVSDPGHVDPLRHARGFARAAAQARLQRTIAGDIAGELDKAKPETYVLSAAQLATLPNRSELERLKALLGEHADEIRIVAHVDEQTRVLVRHYAMALAEGRTTSLVRELSLADTPNWRRAALVDWAKIAPATRAFPEVQAAPHWLDYTSLVARWERVFGAGAVELRGYTPARFQATGLVNELRDMLEIEENIGKAPEVPVEPAVPAATLARWRQMNEVFVRLLETGRHIPRQLWTRLLDEVAIDGDPLDPGSLNDISHRFRHENLDLATRHPKIGNGLTPPQPAAPFIEADPEFGFRATQYAAAFLPRIDQVTKEARRAAEEARKRREQGAVDGADRLTPIAEKILSPRAKENFHALRASRFAPHNRIGRVNEEELAAAYPEAPMRLLPEDNSGNVIVGCMKNEAPYILEWVAYHRMIGVDNFLIYTNGCTDGTDALLDRLQALGIVQRRDNDNWQGNSPQQHALDVSLKEPLIQNAEWVIHIDVDEFINIRTGNGTLADFFARVPGATNVAMTWRLFGHNGVEAFKDDLVIDQFTSAAPKYCPKPHTAWGFKTMTKNIGAYEKLSCHRPNKLGDTPAQPIKWVNGSGSEMTPKYHETGWRSDLQTIGYDMLQLNHYALRSAEGFLVKRQRGRALHVDRGIGLSYWVRMDWGGNKDVTIKRNIPRLRAEMARLMDDPQVKRLHEAGVAWHQAKAAELRETPEFAELYAQAVATDLTEMERVAYALALDVEN
ncbi:MAG TPA: glycosyltransferase family 2 protein [Rhodobacteraceae bacterium]|nr:glycosyltransferase family 2 protein [Paracoccaceae bacterium]